MMTTTRRNVSRAAATFALAATLTGLGAGIATAAPAGAAPSVDTSVVLVDPADTDSDTDPGTETNTDTGTADDGDLSTQSSRRITVTNMSGDTMKLVSVDGDKWFEGRPEDGTSIAPGGSHVWELTYKYFKTNADTVVYDLYKPDGTKDGSVTLDLRVSSNGVSNPSVTSECKSMKSADGLQCSANGNQVTIADQAGTVRELDGSGANATAVAVLQQLCDSNVGATCTYQAVSEELRLGPAKRVGDPLANPTGIQQSMSIAVADQTGSSDSLGGQVQLKIPIKPVELTIQSTYNHTWTRSHTFTQTVPVQTPAKNWGWVERRIPYYEDKGNFTVTFNNTTWKITNVTIKSPAPDQAGVWVVRNQPMTQQEIDDAINGGWKDTPVDRSYTMQSLAGA